MQPRPETIGQMRDQIAKLSDEVDALARIQQQEQARSDLLWELARRRGWVSDEEASIIQRPMS